MGREIRKVPKNWEHPKESSGFFKPLFDETYEECMKNWSAEEYGDELPHEESYRPKFTEEATCFQIYETVSEGTPVSPVFETEEEMLKWLIGTGYSEKASREFIKTGWVMSGMLIQTEKGNVFKRNIHALDDL